jgi:hypothetical protein
MSVVCVDVCNFNPELAWPQPVHDSFALFFQHMFCRSECGEAAFAQQRYFRAGCEGVGGVVSCDNGLHVVGAKPDLQSINQRITGCAIERGEWLVK